MLDVIEPAIATQRLVMDPKAIRDKENQIQITRLTNTRGALKHDDRIDALSHAVQFYSDMLGVDVDKRIVEAEKKEREETIKQWADDDRRHEFIVENFTSGAVKKENETFTPPNRKPRRLFDWNTMRGNGGMRY